MMSSENFNNADAGTPVHDDVFDANRPVHEIPAPGMISGAEQTIAEQARLNRERAQERTAQLLQASAGSQNEARGDDGSIELHPRHILTAQHIIQTYGLSVSEKQLAGMVAADEAKGTN